jgi:alkylglycerol monooxygenase
METYGKILLIAMPAFLFLVLFEKWYGWHKGKDTVRNMDMISSLSSGITNVTKEVLGLTIPIIAYSWFLHRMNIVQLKSTFLMYVAAFVVLDFAGYWMHRWSHKVNFFWNYHIIHHSSEEFNLACALRQSISTIANPFTFLLIPAAMLGVPTEVIATVAPLHLFAQFWYHTRHIHKMGFLEKILVTPSHHRVHHAINPEYLDKNLGQIFIFWDKWFGTFQAELPDKPPVYGITRPVSTWNPIKINFQHLWLLMKDAWRASNWMDKLRVWYKPTGWRPADVATRYPMHKINDVYHFQKYDPAASPALHAWSWVQIGSMLLFISYLFGNLATIGSPAIFIYGGFVFFGVYAYTELMDRNPFAWVWEGLKSLYGAGIIIYTGDWFGASRFVPGIQYGLLAWLAATVVITALFVVKHKKEDAVVMPLATA